VVCCLLPLQNRFLVERVPLFKDCELSIIMQVLQHLTSTMYMPGDYVTRAGDIGDSMYFIRSGLCKILIPDATTKLNESSRSVTFFADVTTSKGEVRRGCSRGFSLDVSVIRAVLLCRK
jgi:hypothetical protein